MKRKKDFLSALEHVREVVVRLRPEHVRLATPDHEWTVFDLLGHMMYELAWVPDIVMGETVEALGQRHNQNLVGRNPIASWRTLAVEASEAVRRCDPEAVAHLSYGDVTVGSYLQEAATDQLIHAWDLGQAIEVQVFFDEDLAQTIYNRMLPRKDELVASGLFAPPIPVLGDASLQTRLLALYGRSENWQKT